MIQTAEEFVRLRKSKDPLEYRRAAYEAAPVSVWQDVVHRFPDMRTWVAHNKTVPLQILGLLARDEDTRVRYSVAMKRKLSQELFELLSRDPDEAVRACIARNKKAPSEILDRLSRDPSRLVREAVAERTKDGGSNGVSAP